MIHNGFDDVKFEDMYDFTLTERGIIQRALRTKLYRKDESTEVRLEKWNVMLAELSEHYGIPTVRLDINTDGDEPGADYDPGSNLIVAQRFSLVSVLCAFGAALIHNNKMEGAYTGLPFMDPRPMGFCLSFFKQAAPIMFQTAKENGRLMGTDALYTDGGKISEEEARRRAAGPNLAELFGQILGQQQPGAQATQDEEPHEGTPDIQMPDIDPENLKDRGNGLGED
jgi:hypothetical protein